MLDKGLLVEEAIVLAEVKLDRLEKVEGMVDGRQPANIRGSRCCSRAPLQRVDVLAKEIRRAVCQVELFRHEERQPRGEGPW